MKTKKDRKEKPLLKVKKENSNGESSLKKAVKNVKAVLKKAPKKKVEAVIKKEKKPVLKRLVKKEKEKKKTEVTKGKKKSKDFIKIEEAKGKKQTKTVKQKTDTTETGRGVVYIGHIPHGFYEEQMKDYFSQFGKVTRVRVSRSKITGRSKGYGYVEFLHPEVAKIAAESMNNYLMSGRLVKAQYIPPEKQHEHYFKGSNWKAGSYPKLKIRMKAIRAVNATKPNTEHKTFVKNTVKKLSKLSQLLKNEGINLKMKLGNVEI